jgi:hypothetical protein
MAYLVSFASRERATQKCKNENQRFESGTIWSMVVLNRYYFPAIEKELKPEQ